MSTETNPQSEAGPQSGPDTNILAPEQLTAVREARGWSKAEVAARLGMMPRQIDAMENGRWEDLPGHAFVRGGLRAYAKALEVDVSPLLAALAEPGVLPELRRSTSLDSSLPRRGALGFGSGGSGSRIAWILLGVVGVVVIALYFARAGEPDVREPVSIVDGVSGGATDSQEAVAPAAGATAMPASDAEPVASEPVSNAPGGAGALANASGREGRVASVESVTDPALRTESSTSAGEPTDAALSPTAEAVSGTSSARSDAGGSADNESAAGTGSSSALVFHFERESWVEVRDGEGQVLMRGLQSAGSRREVSGPKPWAMTIGNADFVRIEQDGSPVDLGPVTQKGVARLRIE